jgi:cation transport ATPase
MSRVSGSAGGPYLQFALASVVFLYGGWPFLAGLFSELRKLAPGMMTLIGVAVVTAYGYSSPAFGAPPGIDRIPERDRPASTRAGRGWPARLGTCA